MNEFSTEVGVDSIDPAEEGTLERREDVTRKTNKESRVASHSNQKFVPKEPHEYMLENPWALGLKRQCDSDVMLIRSAAKRTNEKKNELRKAIVRSMKEKRGGESSCKVGIECDHLPDWQKYVRRRSNNLRLNPSDLPDWQKYVRRRSNNLGSNPSPTVN